MTEPKGKIHIDYHFEDRKGEGDEVIHGVRMEVNVLKEIQVEEASQVMLQAYMNIASKVLEKHIVSGCTGCPACGMHESILRAIDDALPHDLYGDVEKGF